jgi:hypothetical protein
MLMPITLLSVGRQGKGQDNDPFTETQTALPKPRQAAHHSVRGQVAGLTRLMIEC